MPFHGRPRILVQQLVELVNGWIVPLGQYCLGSTRGQSLLEVAEQVHQDFADNLKFARVWGSQVHDGTQVSGDYVPYDRDVVELHV